MLKLALFAGMILLLYNQLLSGAEKLSDVETFTFPPEGLSLGQVLLILLCIGLVPLNWALETLKWQLLMKPAVSITFPKAFKAVLAGLTVSLFTPNRIGEYGGRLLHVSSEYRLPTVYATIIGSMAQWIALMAGGLLGIFYLISAAVIENALGNYILILSVTGIFLLTFLLFCYWRLSIVTEKAANLPFLGSRFQNLRKKMVLVYSDKELNASLQFSFLRYSVYTLQYLLILLAVGLNFNIIEGLAGIAFVYLLQTGLPVPPSMGLLARGSIALWVFSMILPDSLGINEQGLILLSTFLLWVINVLIPASLGAVFIAGKINKNL
jgi:hypothetical protein